MSRWIPVFFICGVLGMNLYATTPKPEHPRPDWRREHWQNLNGIWRFAFEEGQSGEKLSWQDWPKRDVKTRSIVAPYPWESRLSGIHEPERRGTGWYFRYFRVPADWQQQRIWLVIGAADFETTVWVNGTRIGHHVGGYDPFSFDITDACRFDGENALVIRVSDLLDRSQPSGKQTDWYTPTSGIWQTVYLEARPATYIQDATLRTDSKTGTVSWSIRFAGDLKKPLYLEIAPEPDPEGLVTAPVFGPAQTFPINRSEIDFDLKISSPRLWAPGSPNLYFCRLTLKTDQKVLDTVHTYFGIRSISHQPLDGKPYEYIYLNDRPIYLMGALDQSFNPDGIYTFPDDKATRFDVEKALDFGFNFLRIHIKLEEPRFYYWADRLGLLIMQDMPNFNRYDERAKQFYIDMLDAGVQRDKNHPCIFAWVLFNETWGLEKQKTKEGQQWVEKMYHHTKKLDPTRLVEDNSPCRLDHVITDINSWHFYHYKYADARNSIEYYIKRMYPGSKFNFIGDHVQGTQPVMNSEYGGVSAGMGDRDISWCFHYITPELRRHEKVCGYIYTELMDIEWEHNGMMDYDRSPKEFGYGELVPVPEGQPPFSVRDLNHLDFLGIDIPPLEAHKPGEAMRVTTWISRFSRKRDETLLVNWRLSGVNALGEIWRSAGLRTRVSAPQYAVSPLTKLDLGALPKDPMLFVLCVVAEDKNGNVVARNFATFHTLNKPSPRKEISGQRCILRWKPGDISTEIWKNKIHRFKDGGNIYGEGCGRIEYQVTIPRSVIRAVPEKIEILVELGAHAGKAKVDWPQRTKETDYPQTEPDKKFPTDVTVFVNGTSIETLLIPDDPADIRGLLSNLSGRRPGAYGYLQKIRLPQDQVSKLSAGGKSDTVVHIAFQVKENATHRGGISIYGEREGRYPVDPTLMITTKNEIRSTQ